MLSADTILERKEPYADDHHLAPFNRIRIVGASPVLLNGPTLGSWAGGDSKGITIQPTSFGPTVDRPYGEIMRDYSVVEEPQKTRSPITIVVEEALANNKPTPEEIFKAAAQLATPVEQKKPVGRPRSAK